MADHHGDPVGVDQDAFLGDDPALALAGADMDVWLAAHPCDCETLCECEQEAT